LEQLKVFLTFRFLICDQNKEFRHFPFERRSQSVIAFFSGLMQIRFVSDKQLALDSIERLPEDANLDAIAERVEFLAAIRKGLGQIERGETVPHEEVKRQLATWLSK
jgi:hypothetical protein